MYEPLRLQGPSGRVARTAVQDSILPRAAPVFVPKDTIVALNTYRPNHWKDNWGDDVEEFRPHRWIGSKRGIGRRFWQPLEYVRRSSRS